MRIARIAQLAAIVAGTILGSALPAGGGILIETESQTKAFSVQFGGANLASLSFAPFDTQGGERQLLSVSLVVDSESTLDVGFENLSAFAISQPIQFGAQLNGSASAGGLVFGFPAKSSPLVDATLVLAAADAPAPNQSGADYIDFGTVSGPIALVQLLGGAGSQFVAKATGPGQVGVTFSAAHFLQFPSPPVPGTGIRRWISDYSVQGEATLVYEFSIVPTTGTAWLAMIALTLAAVRRR
ncbi:MAG: choice-of-anchor E domain-containing protein [Phycisphaerales bacterium]